MSFSGTGIWYKWKKSYGGFSSVAVLPNLVMDANKDSKFEIPLVIDVIYVFIKGFQQNDIRRKLRNEGLLKTSTTLKFLKSPIIDKNRKSATLFEIQFGVKDNHWKAAHGHYLR